MTPPFLQIIKISKQFKKWNIDINSDKRESKIFILIRINNVTKIIIYAKEIEWNTTTVKYLSVHIDTRLIYTHKKQT